MNSFISSQRVCAIVATVALTFGAGAVLAKDIKVNLTGGEETPPVSTAATAAGTFKIDKDKSISGSIKTVGIDGTVAHIHLGTLGQSGPPIITLEKTADGVWSVPAGSKLTDEQFAAYKAGGLYVNVHSAEHKPGEIRAQLKPS
jgi:hypothetical protein